MQGWGRLWALWVWDWLIYMSGLRWKGTVSEYDKNKNAPYR